MVTKMKTKHIIFSLLLAGFAVSCGRSTSSINLEMAHNESAHHILSPGLGWLGIIQDQEVHMFYFTRSYTWEVDNVHPFAIPEKNDGLLGMGLGSIGVVSNGALHLYIQDQGGKWTQDERYNLELPRGYRRIFTVKQEWELAYVAMEFDGRIQFYYFDEEQGLWLQDETATFILPQGIEDYFSMGNMTIAIVSDNKLGLYYLHTEGNWTFAEDYVLQLPENRLAVIPFEPGIIAVMEPWNNSKRLQFYQLDISSDMWIIEEAMNFYLN
jgi:hypothetical protein